MRNSYIVKIEKIEKISTLPEEFFKGDMKIQHRFEKVPNLT